jgi:hypothetical protein
MNPPDFPAYLYIEANDTSPRHTVAAEQPALAITLNELRVSPPVSDTHASINPQMSSASLASTVHGTTVTTVQGHSASARSMHNHAQCVAAQLFDNQLNNVRNCASENTLHKGTILASGGLSA